MVEKDAEGEEELGRHGRGDEKRDKRCGAGWPWIINKQTEHR